MTGTTTGRDFLDALGASLSQGLGGLMERLFGANVNATLSGHFTWADLGVLITFLVLLAFVHWQAATFLRRKAAAAQARAGEWRADLFVAAGKPMYLLIWLYGTYLLASVLMKWGGTDQPQPARQVIGGMFDAGVFFAVCWLFFRLTRIVESRLVARAGVSVNKWDDVFIPLLARTARVLVPVVAVILALPVLGLPLAYEEIISKASSLLVVAAVAWILIQSVKAFEQFVLSKYDVTVADNLQARKIHTQVRVISKALYVTIGIFAVASALMLFEEVRRLGTSILASAGIVGIIVGFAAQRTIANLFAGFQLAMTQPIRLDDVVIIEGEWGRVEEVTLTFVVVRIWDERRLVVPLNYFIEKPFQNWTRVSAELLGSVFVWADYSLPVERLRSDVKDIVSSCPDWDGRFWNVQVTDANERAMQIRVLATAADSGKAWNLRCEIRERLIALIQRNHKDSLPKLRADVSNGSHPEGEGNRPALLERRHPAD